MRCGDAKCVGWKDLFPPVLKLLSDYPKLMLNGIAITGPLFRQQCIQTLVTMKWPKQIFTPIAMMFRYVEFACFVNLSSPVNDRFLIDFFVIFGRPTG